VSMAFVSLDAAPKNGKAPKAPKAVKAAQAPKATGTAKAPKLAKAANTPKAKVVAAKSTKPRTSTTTTVASKPSTSTTTSTMTTGGTTTPVDFTSGKVAQNLAKNNALRTKLEAQLKALGYGGTVYQAAYGFKNQGQLVAAVNNAQNHTLSFEQIKTLMTGVSVDPAGVVLKANLNPDGSITMLPPAEVTNPAPTSSLGQAKKFIASTAPPAPETEAAATARN
jgi:hypothetical protein